MKRLIIVLLFLIPIYISAQWEIVHQNKWGYFTSLDLVNDTLGFITTDKGYILRTTDKGLNWHEFNKLNWTLSDIQFLDEDHGWVLGRMCDHSIGDPFFSESIKLLRTEDGGKTWNLLESDTSYFYKYQFVTPSKGWAIKFKNYYEDLKLVYTLDGGESWIETG